MTQPGFLNFCRWNSTTSGTGTFTVGTARSTDITGPHDTLANCGSVNGTLYRYYAQSADGTQTELGVGTAGGGGTTFARTTIIANSNGDTSQVNFATNPIVDVFPNPIRNLSGISFPAGTLMLFQQTSAPLGWTKQTSHNDKALRVVSGTAGSGGSNAFSTVFAQTTTGNHTLALSEIASHAHNNPSQTGAGPGPSTDLMRADDTGVHTNLASDANGGGGAHNHPITMSIQFVDLIIASKN